MLAQLRLINTSLEEIWVEEHILCTDSMLAVEFLTWHVTFAHPRMCFSKQQTYQHVSSEKLFHKPASVINPGAGATTRESSGATLRILSVSPTSNPGNVVLFPQQSRHERLVVCPVHGQGGTQPGNSTQRRNPLVIQSFSRMDHRKEKTRCLPRNLNKHQRPDTVTYGLLLLHC